MVLLRTRDRETFDKAKDILMKGNIRHNEAQAFSGKYITCNEEQYEEATQLLRESIKESDKTNVFFEME